MSQSLEVETVYVGVCQRGHPMIQEHKVEEVGVGAAILSGVRTGRRQVLPAHSWKEAPDLPHARILPLEFGC